MVVVIVLGGEVVAPHLVARFRLDPGNRRERVADFPLEVEILLSDRAPVLGQVVLVTMAVGGPRHVTGGNVKQRGAGSPAELDDVGDSGRVDLDRPGERRLEVDQSGAVNHRVEAVALEWLRAVVQQAGMGNVAGNDRDLVLDIAIEARAEMLAQRSHHRRIENLAPKTVQAGAFVAADEEIDSLDFGMMPEHQVQKDLAEKSGAPVSRIRRWRNT